jgi:hypothetical protein
MGAYRRQQIRIAAKVARVLGQIFLVVELGRIDEYRHETYVVLAHATPHKAGVTFMQRTHGRNKPDGFVLPFAGLCLTEEFLLGGNDLHTRNLLKKAGKGTAFFGKNKKKQ